MPFSGFSPFPRPPSPEVFQALFNTRFFFGFLLLDTFPLLAVRFFGFLSDFLCCLHLFFLIFLFLFVSLSFFLAFSGLCFFRVLAFGHFFWSSSMPLPAPASLCLLRAALALLRTSDLHPCSSCVRIHVRTMIPFVLPLRANGQSIHARTMRTSVLPLRANGQRTLGLAISHG